MRLLMIVTAMTGAAACFGVVVAQQSPQIDPETLNRVQQLDPDTLRQVQELERNRLQLPERLQVQPNQVEDADFRTGSGYRRNPDTGLWYGWVNFDQEQQLGLLEGRRAQLGWREQAGGVRFAAGQAEGARIVRCGTGSNTCAVPQPDSPEALVAGAESGVLRVDFAQPVTAVTALVAPDRGFGTEPDLFVIEGWRNGDIASIARADVEIYDSQARGWTRLTLSGLAETARATTAVAAGGGSGQEFDYVIIRAVTANGAPVETPIVLDSLRFADRHGPTPFDSLGPRAGGLEDMLAETGRTAARLQERAQIVRRGGRREGMAYPVAEQMRMPLDMSAARAAAVRQRTFMSLDLPAASGLVGREAVTLPIVAPLGVFQGEDPGAGLAEGVRFSGRRDYFHLRFDSEIGRVVISGTRVVTRPQAGDLRPGEISVSAGYDGAYASFNLYGAAYSVRVACGTEALGEACNDPEALRTLLDRLFLWMPQEA